MLKGQRVTLRALDPADAETVWRWYHDHEFSLLDGNIYGTSLETTRAFLASLQSPGFPDVSLGIEDEHGTLIGLVRLKRVRAEDRCTDFGIAIARAYWSRGYGTDTTRAILRFAFEEMGLHRVQLGYVEYNARARRCYDKCGFTEEGRERRAKYREGRWYDNVLMAILEDEFRALDVAHRD
jgi:RimJ/RimL family protein N-acetyltransferase